MAGSPNPATGEAWDTAIPDNSQPHGNDYLEHHETKLAVAIRMNKEHVAFATASAGGEHKPGSAICYFGDFSDTVAGDLLPTKCPDGATGWRTTGTTLSATDNGRLAYDTDAVFGGIMYRYVYPNWVALGYINLLTAQTIAGVKTFSAAPVFSAGAAFNSQKATGLASGTASGDAVQFGQFTTAAADTVSTTLPGGLIMKWGTETYTLGSQEKTFAVAFPNACYAVFTTVLDSSPTYSLNVTASSKTGFTVESGSSSVNNFSWFAIGY
jgi:hypothetical protein